MNKNIKTNIVVLILISLFGSIAFTQELPIVSTRTLDSTGRISMKNPFDFPPSSRQLFETSIIQKPTDTPKDVPIKIVAYDGSELCFAPIFTQGESYIQLQQCLEKNVIKARYDVFERIAYKIENVWLCITLPKNVIQGNAQWDYVHLEPCAINNPAQRWIVKENAFWSADGKYRLKEYQWQVSISKDSKANYNHTLDPSMREWINTIATPGNMSIKTFIAWDYNSEGVKKRYYLKKNHSVNFYSPLYYNPQNGHIAQYNSKNGFLYCMRSQMGTHKWNWIDWYWCDDETLNDGNNSTYWDISFVTKQGGIIKDHKDNALRVAQKGSDWGVPYTTKIHYLQGNTTNSPTSIFFFNKDLQDWISYVNKNRGEMLPYCPAPGVQTIKTKTIRKHYLPSNFKLDQAWIERLYNIATSTQTQERFANTCGSCLLQSFQMIAELQEHYPQKPIQNGGYFFDTMPNTNPFISFHQRFPLLHDTLENILRWYSYPIVTGENTMLSLQRLAYTSAVSILPLYDWEQSQIFFNQIDIITHLQTLLNSPIGTIWLAIAHRDDVSKTLHIVPIVRAVDGLAIIQTSVINTTLSAFRDHLNSTTNIDTIYKKLSLEKIIDGFFTMRLKYSYPQTNNFDLSLSTKDCSGSAENRRGNALFPNFSSINQCWTKRCAWSQ